MDLDLKTEDILSRVKAELLKNKIKLWLQPYYDEEKGVNEEEEIALQLLSEQLVEQLNVGQEQCLAALRELQSHSLERLKSNQTFKDTGVATVRVKVSGERAVTLSVNISLASNAEQLMDEVAKQIGVSMDRIKLIANGRVLKPELALVAQQVKNSQMLMACILADQGKLQEEEKRMKTLESTKRDVKLLAGSSNLNNEFFFQVENQSGEQLNLPPHERKALVTAMTLHEKGRAALKREDYPLALVLLLEADKEFSDCTSKLLSACDNYALLHLDIAWCYLCLRNPAQIPDAEHRLQQCEQNFHKSYGPNLERLMALKGTTGNEAALFMRLHLLQGVVCYYQNRRSEARQLFERAQSELNGLKVDDDSICLLMELGFTSAEARLGLRATHGNVEAAEELIQRKRRDKQQNKEKNLLQRKQDKEKLLLGLCADKKQYVEPSHVERLTTMGFNRQQSIAALKLSNNNISEALTLIQEQPHLLPSCSSSVSEESLAQIVSLGFDIALARQAIEHPDFDRVFSSLTSLSSASASSSSDAAVAASASAISFMEELRKRQKKKLKQAEEANKAFQRVSEDLIDNDLTEDHLDLNLTLEEQFLTEYLSLLD